MRFPSTKWAAALGFALLAAASAGGLSGCSSHAETTEPVRPAIVAQPVAASAQVGTLYTGDVKARYESALGFRVGGKIKRRLVDVGAHVDAGQLIAELDPADLNLQAASARASLAAAEADASLARSERERYAKLRDKHFVSATEFDAVDNKAKAAAARLSEARAAVAVAQNQADYSALRADHAGVVTTITAEAGQVVASGQTIANLARDGEREVEIAVPEGRIGHYHIGQAATVAAWAEQDKPLTGQLREIAPEADPVTRTYRVRVALDVEPATVKLGQTARVYFAGDGGAAAQLVPLASLYEKDGKPALWRLDTKTQTVHLVPVTVSAYRQQGVLIASGVDARDWVVSAGVHKLHEGQSILPVDGDNRPLKL
jgi:multidrug efflux system membrane fusion protein